MILWYHLFQYDHFHSLLLFFSAAQHFTGSSRKVRETNREEPNEHKEETVISVAISKALGNFNETVPNSV